MPTQRCTVPLHKPATLPDALRPILRVSTPSAVLQDALAWVFADPRRAGMTLALRTQHPRLPIAAPKDQISMYVTPSTQETLASLAETLGITPTLLASLAVEGYLYNLVGQDRNAL